MKSVVRVSDIWVDDLFEWFYHSVMNDCGDGAAVICCSNHEETAAKFVEWWRKNKMLKIVHILPKDQEFFHPKSVHSLTSGGNVVNYHDANENFMFCDKELLLDFGDKSFIVEGDCKSIHIEGFVCKSL